MIFEPFSKKICLVAPIRRIYGLFVPYFQQGKRIIENRDILQPPVSGRWRHGMTQVLRQSSHGPPRAPRRVPSSL